MVKLLSGHFASIQDLGRLSYRSIGVPVSGVMDAYSAGLANLILNNQVSDAVLEITFGSTELLFEKDCSICITGADFSAQINNQFIPLNSAIHVTEGSVLSFGRRKYGIRTYLAIKGGFKTESTLESRSLYEEITGESFLKEGDILPILLQQKTYSSSYSSVKINKDHFSTKTIECYEGPEFELLSEEQRKQLSKTLFTISPDNSRMGYRLEELVENNLPSMLTSAVLPGTVQLTPSGKLIVLMKDCQATGGYPRVLQLTENAISQLAQKTTGEQFSLRIISC